MKNRGEVYDQKMGVLTEEIGGRNHEEVALRTTLMICSDQRCGDGGRTASVVEGYRGSCALSQISVKAR